MFEVKSNFVSSHFFIRDRFVSGIDTVYRYLHCDGRVIDVCEYFESKEAAQAVLDRFYPEPEHVWKHGDVFTPTNNTDEVMIYLETFRGVELFCVGNGKPCLADHRPSITTWLKDAIFLFNIKEKL